MSSCNAGRPVALAIAGVLLGITMLLLAGLGCRTPECGYHPATHIHPTSFHEQSRLAAERELLDRPSVSRRGWWHILFISEDCYVEMVRICQANASDATSVARTHLLSLRDRKYTGQGTALALAPDESCPLNAVAYEEY